MEEKKGKRNLILGIIGIIVLVAGVIGLTYAYFNSRSQSDTITVTSANLELTFDDSTPIIRAEDIEPIIREDNLTKGVKKTFKITNTGNKKLFVDITLEDIAMSEEFKRYDFIWSLYEGDANVSNGDFVTVADNQKSIAPYQVLDVGEEKTYNLYIWIEETGLDQSTMMNKSFSGKIVATGTTYHTTDESCFTFNSSTGSITGYSYTCPTDVIIPPTINGVAVSSIGDYAFFQRESGSLTSVVIPNSVTTIGEEAFGANSLTSVVIPNSVTTIEENAFETNQLTSIVIPNSVTTIGRHAFQYNQLTSVVIPNSVTHLSGFDYNPLSNGIIIPNSVTTIGVEAFMGDSAIQVVIMGNSVTTISSSSFEQTAFSSLIIPSSVTTVENYAFTAAGISEIIVEGKSSLSEFTDSTGLTTEGDLPSGTTIIFKP